MSKIDRKPLAKELQAVFPEYPFGEPRGRGPVESGVETLAKEVSDVRDNGVPSASVREVPGDPLYAA